MELIWIPISIFAALMQAVRTAAQKTLNESMSTMGTTYVRSLAGLPFIAGFLALLSAHRGGGLPPITIEFMVYTVIGALAQVLATALLIKMFTLRSFAVGTMLTKTDILMTAVIGSALFSERLTAIGWIALVIIVAGVILMLVGKLGVHNILKGNESLTDLLTGRATRIALMCALMFTASYLCFREATLILQPGNFLWRGTWTVLIALTMQTFFLSLWLAWKQPRVFGQLRPNRRIISFIGISSALGSIGWFAAFALQNASYVRAVGQIEAVFTLTISWFYFQEKITRTELFGMFIMIAGVLLFRLES